MTAFQPPKVLVLARNPEVGRRWADLIRGTAAQVWFSTAEAPTEQIEVLLTDLRSCEEAQRQSGLAICPDKSNSPARSPVGVVAIGPAMWADIHLPENCTASEVSLACSLLAEIVRLRIQLDASDRVQREIKQFADTDPLTGLPNRRAWDRQLRLKCDGTNTVHHPLWLAIVDLDHFKEINDRWGLVEGDHMLAYAAQALAGQLRSADVIARLGGDEFGVLLTGIDEQSLLGVFDRLRAAVAAQVVETCVGRLTASIGYASASENCSVGDLFAAAEKGLRQAKRAGGDRAIRGEIGQPRGTAPSLGRVGDGGPDPA